MSAIREAMSAMAEAGRATGGPSGDDEAAALRAALEAVTDLLADNYDGRRTVGEALWDEFDAALTLTWD